MRCPKCDCIEDKVIDSRSSKEGAIIRRRRECNECQHRFTTYEQIEHQRLMVVKRDGRREEFSREKLFSGIAKACQKRPISQQSIEDLTQRIYDTISEEYAEEDKKTASRVRRGPQGSGLKTSGEKGRRAALLAADE